ncbi:Mechanosensitive ion channel protein Msy2 like [Verticillium longisporum]|uniref:Mechanosensitive ion channel protein Msy2 like n=1 Tax=Verticillium longisporum TaxID=100787 RepID=A0A8I3AJL2_VERLO|nr:Mechanosensitive ion channel protein Msy2 like [Verticillium longisporum]
MTLSPRHSGFIPIRRSHSKEMVQDQGIPLTQVKSHASSTGARRPNMNIAMDGSGSGQETPDEKQQLHARGRAGRRKGKALSRNDTAGSDEVSLNAMGRLYKKIIGASVVTRYLVYIIPIGILLAIPLVVLPITGHRNDLPVGRSSRDGDGNRTPGPALFRLFLWIEIAWLTLWAGKVVAWLLPRVFMFVVGVVSTGTRKYATVLQNLQIPMSFFFWALASWLTFRGLFGGFNNVHWVKVIVTILGALFSSAAVYLAEKAIVQLIGISYHQRSFALRIKACKREVHLLGLLYDASRTLFPMYCAEFEEDDDIISDSILAQTGKKVGGAAVPLKFVGNIGRVGDKVTAAFGNVASEITGKQVFNPNSAHSIVIEALEKTKSSEALARRIWMAFVCEGNDSLYLEDVQEVLGPSA